MYVLLSNKVRGAISKILRVCTRWCQAYLTLKKEITSDAKAKINGATYNSHAGKISNY
jgi:ACT domain-containing protein